MPLPAARNTHPNVDPPGATRSGVAARAHPQVDRLLRGREPTLGQVRLVARAKVRFGHLRGFPETTASTPQPRPAHGARARQRLIPPRRLASPIAAQVSACAQARVPASVQSPAPTDRAALDTSQ